MRVPSIRRNFRCAAERLKRGWHEEHIITTPIRRSSGEESAQKLGEHSAPLLSYKKEKGRMPRLLLYKEIARVRISG
jgi:hypothetical protein